MSAPRRRSGQKRATATPAAQVRVAPGIRLSPAQVALLAEAFSRAGDSGQAGVSLRIQRAVVLLVSVGAGRAPLVVKLAHPHDLQREYNAYEEYVRQVSPQNIAHLQGEPGGARRSVGPSAIHSPAANRICPRRAYRPTMRPMGPRRRALSEPHLSRLWTALVGE